MIVETHYTKKYPEKNYKVSHWDKILRPKENRGKMRKLHLKKTTTTANLSCSLFSFPIL